MVDIDPIADTELDPAGLYFVSYDGLVNVASYQQSGILSHDGWQYAAWYTASRHAVVARRRLPEGEWSTATLPHRLSVDDSHNSISLGVSPADGRLHVAMDTHDSPVHYLRSEPGEWSADLFGPVQRTLDGLDLGAITYPRFVLTPERRLQLSFRTGRSGNGVMELAEYDAGRWTALGAWTSATGTYRAGNGATSAHRNLYLHGFGYGPGGRLHASFTWREDSRVIPGLPNHDTGYVVSDDRGRTWCTADGTAVAVTGSAHRLGVETPGHVVDPLGVGHALINQESQAIDSADRPHVVVSYVPERYTVTDVVLDRIAYARPFHLHRDSGGGWHKTEIPVPVTAFGRSQLVLDAADDAYVVLPRLRIASASAASGWTDWTLRYDGTDLDAFGEVTVDRERVAAEGVLSVLYQRTSFGATPSAVCVADFRVGHRPRPTLRRWPRRQLSP